MARGAGERRAQPRGEPARARPLPPDRARGGRDGRRLSGGGRVAHAAPAGRARTGRTSPRACAGAPAPGRAGGGAAPRAARA
ncbi:MAG: hypothetical protein FJ381_13835 [Verrucomicrobia bacterium]|nr:hypothetical protein [Verrucomicrobiota bacterium]